MIADLELVQYTIEPQVYTYFVPRGGSELEPTYM